MDHEARIWQISTIIVMVCTAIMPVYVAYDLFSKGSIPPKKILLKQLNAIYPLKDLSTLREKVSLSLSIDNETIYNVILVKSWLKNAGSTPILPSDYYKNISVSVKEPWKIISVENSNDLPIYINFTWKKITDTKFEAEPALINPNDIVSTHIYLTNTKFNKESKPNKQKSPNVQWRGRIANLSSFTKIEPDFFIIHGPDISVDLEGWGLFFTIAAALIFQAIYLHLLSQSGLIHDINLITILFIVGSSFLSFAAAESISTYLFGRFFTKLAGGVPHWLNAPWIILHLLVLFLLYRKSRKVLSAAA